MIPAQKYPADCAERLLLRQGRRSAQQYALATLLPGDDPEGQEDPHKISLGIMAFGYEPPVPNGGVVAGPGANVAQAGPPPPLDGVGPDAEHSANEMEGNAPNDSAVATG